jgi:hypothetical protein
MPSEPPPPPDPARLLDSLRDALAGLRALAVRHPEDARYRGAASDVASAVAKLDADPPTPWACG